LIQGRKRLTIDRGDKKEIKNGKRRPKMKGKQANGQHTFGTSQRRAESAEMSEKTPWKGGENHNTKKELRGGEWQTDRRRRSFCQESTARPIIKFYCVG